MAELNPDFDAINFMEEPFMARKTKAITISVNDGKRAPTKSRS